jgi:hypothetical protein
MTWTTCARCVYGAGKHCPDGAPLPFTLRHNCLHFRARDLRAPDAKPWHELGEVGLLRNHQSCREWIARVRDEDTAKGFDRLMREGLHSPCEKSDG